MSKAVQAKDDTYIGARPTGGYVLVSNQPIWEGDTRFTVKLQAPGAEIELFPAEAVELAKALLSHARNAERRESANQIEGHSK